MRTGKKLTAEILSGKWDEALKKLYMDNQKIQQQKKRYVKAVASYCEILAKCRLKSIVHRAEVKWAAIIQTTSMAECLRHL